MKKDVRLAGHNPSALGPSLVRATLRPLSSSLLATARGGAQGAAGTGSGTIPTIYTEPSNAQC